MIRRAALAVGLITLATVATLPPWGRWVWLQWQVEPPTPYGPCGDDPDPYPGHLSANVAVGGDAVLSVVLEYCRPRKAGDPRTVRWMFIGAGVSQP